MIGVDGMDESLDADSSICPTAPAQGSIPRVPHPLEFDATGYRLTLQSRHYSESGKVSTRRPRAILPPTTTVTVTVGQ